jgi:hypothetical protein
METTGGRKYVEGTGLGDTRNGWKERLVDEVGKAVQAGWAQTARLMVLLTAGTAAITLITLITLISK